MGSNDGTLVAFLAGLGFGLGEIEGEIEEEIGGKEERNERLSKPTASIRSIPKTEWWDSFKIPERDSNDWDGHGWNQHVQDHKDLINFLKTLPWYFSKYRLTEQQLKDLNDWKSKISASEQNKRYYNKNLVKLVEAWLPPDNNGGKRKSRKRKSRKRKSRKRKSRKRKSRKSNRTRRQQKLGRFLIGGQLSPIHHGVA